MNDDCIGGITRVEDQISILKFLMIIFCNYGKINC